MKDSDEYCIHPKRFPKNAPGPFYTLGYVLDGKWSGECMACTLPEGEAPELLAALDETNSDTYFVRQPQSEEEIQRACRAAEVCCVDAIRYGGKDPRIIRRLGPKLCDHAKATRRWWQFWKGNT